MRIQTLSVEEAVASLRSTPQGLSTGEARRRLAEYGPNRMERVAAEPLALRVLKEFTHFFALILWVAAALAFLAEWSAPGQGMARVGYAIVAVIVVSGIFSFWQKHRIERILAELQKLLPRQVKVQRDGALARLAAEELVPGDLVLIEQGDRVPADCRLLEATGLRVNDATVTGESLPRSCDAAPSAAPELTRSRNVVLAGTSVAAGEVRALAFATGMHSEFGKIAHLAQAAGREASPLRVELARLSRTIALLAVTIGLAGEHPQVATGEQLRAWSDTQLRLALDAPEILFARVAADQKTRIVEALKQKRHVVAVTGGGVNDAPALKSAHIGIAMGLSGTDVAKESADMVLLDDNFTSIVSAVEEGRALFDNMRKFLTYILAHNVPELVPYLAFALFGIPLPLTPIQILAIDMGTDSLTALGLGTERAGPADMRRPARARDERLLDWRLAVRAYLFLGPIKAAAAMAAFFFVLRGAGWRYGEPAGSSIYLQATTACLTAIVVMQVVNVFLCRSRMRSVFSVGLGGNRLILWGVLLEVALIVLIDYTPVGNLLFATAPLEPRVWLFLLPFAVAMLALEELRKWVARRLLAAGSARTAGAPEGAAG